MALSNIFREPRREITESFFGVVAVVLLIWADWRFANWFYVFTGGNSNQYACPVPLGIVLGLLALFFLVLLWYFAHYVGEWICDNLSDLGLDPRPKNRK